MDFRVNEAPSSQEIREWRPWSLVKDPFTWFKYPFTNWSVWLPQTKKQVDTHQKRGHRLSVWFLAHLVMSLCNHALSVVCCCRCHWHRHLCTTLPVTGLIIEASYLTSICSYAPSICTWNIKSMWHIFFKWRPFSKFLYLALLSIWLNLEPSYLAQLCTYTGATHREEIIDLSIIFLKLWIFKKNSHFALFDSLAKMLKILSL